MTEIPTSSHPAADPLLPVTASSKSSTPPSVNPCSQYSSPSLPPSFVSSSSSTTSQCSGYSSSTLTSSIRPSTKPLTSPASAQSLSLSSPVCHSAARSTGPNSSTLPPASAFTPICPVSSHSYSHNSSHHLPSTPPSSVPQSPQVCQQSPRTLCNQLSVSSSHNSLDGEVQVSDIYFVSSPVFALQFFWFLFCRKYSTLDTNQFKGGKTNHNDHTADLWENPFSGSKDDFI